MEIYDIKTYDYYLPPELIAQYPANPRDTSRLLVLDRATGKMSDRFFYEIVEFLGENHILVLNETRVIPARLIGYKPTGGRVEVLLLHQEGDQWHSLVRPARRVKAGTVINFREGVKAEVTAELDFAGGRCLRFTGYNDWYRFLDTVGEIPLPPYINRPSEEKDRLTYQTVYANQPGSAAAPTAGLHFTPELLAELEDRKVEMVKILLHVGLGTFRPVESEDIRQHQMHYEYFEVGPGEAERLNRARKQGKTIVAVGTTVVRTLESAYDDEKGFVAGKGMTDKFIYPGYHFRAVDSLVTNFHLPRSSLLMLVCALAGVEQTLEAYRHAVNERYRFFSYGDAMFVK